MAKKRRKKVAKKRKASKKCGCPANSSLSLKMLTKKRDGAQKEIDKRQTKLGVVKRVKA